MEVRVFSTAPALLAGIHPHPLKTPHRTVRALIGAALLTVGWCAAAAAQFIGGSYDVSGTGLDAETYHGTATITPTSNSTCRIHWQIDSGHTADGICMVSNGSFVADYEMSGVRGLAIYQLQPDGSLKGVWTASNRPGIGKEDLVPAK